MMLSPFFSEDAVYEDSAGGRHVGHKAIRTAFEPLVGGSRGSIRFDGEDVFAEVETGKVLASWRLSLDKDGDVSVIRGIDVLEFQGDKLAKKLAYMKVDKPHLEVGNCEHADYPNLAGCGYLWVGINICW